MKIKPIDKEHLMVVLSQTESDYLGFGPQMNLRSFRVKFVISRIFHLASSCCNFSLKGQKAEIQVLLCKGGNTVLFFSEEKKKKYRLKETKAPFICIFEDCDALIMLFIRLKGLSKKAFKLYLFRSGKSYGLLVLPLEENGKELRTLFREYGEVKQVSKKRLKTFFQKGQKLKEQKL